MSLDINDEILQDFLVEAGELLDGLNEQLVELEQHPDDRDLLNAVFRSFHSIKGGAGFLNLHNLVAVCHRAEDVFNVLRQGHRQVDSALMDAVLQVVDVVTGMFREIRAGQEPSPADAGLLSVLESLAMPDGGAPSAAPEAAAQTAPVEISSAENAAPSDASAGEEFTDEEFDALLDAMKDGGSKSAKTAKSGKPAQPAPPDGTEADEARGDDEITEDEFEQLLDQLHGKDGVPRSVSAPKSETSEAGSGELITEDEFEQLLDKLHGKSRSPEEEACPPSEAPAETPPQQPSIPSARPATPDTRGGGPEPDPAASAATLAAETTVRVDTKRLDDIMNLVGELVLVRNRLVTLGSKIDDDEVGKAVGNLDTVTSDLQTAVMKTRMQPIKKIFGRFPRVVRDLARSLKKEVHLELRGEETDLDKNQVEALADPLIHLVRNAVDHGIEGPDERERQGKPRAGHVVLAAEQEGDHILLTITDDGKGMDPEVLRRKAVEKGLVDEETAARMSDQNALGMIFMAGFSTKAEISDVSGRGVGMDVVKTRITELNGRVEIDSRKGEGSTLRIKVPLTLAILPTLMVVLEEQRFALPLANVREVFNLDPSQIRHVSGREVIMVRNQALPLHYLRRWLINGSSPKADRGGQPVVVVIFAGDQQVGFVVDRLLGQEEVVIKPLGPYLHGLPGFVGATITGDGGIALILDVPGLLRAHTQGP